MNVGVDVLYWTGECVVNKRPTMMCLEGKKQTKTQQQQNNSKPNLLWLDRSEKKRTTSPRRYRDNWRQLPLGVIWPSLLFLMLSHCIGRLFYHFLTAHGPFSSVQFSSVQDSIYALRKAHMRSTRSFSPMLPFETNPVFGLIDWRWPFLRPLSRKIVERVPLSTPLSSLQPIVAL